MQAGQRNDNERDNIPAPQSVGKGNLGDLCQNVLPVWSGQIDVARAQMESAALHLVNHFVGIATRIDQITQTLAGAEHLLSAPGNAGGIAPLAESFKVLHAEGEAISRAVHEGIVALQFQDRVNQILSAVRSDLERLRSQVDEQGHLPASFDVGAWLDNLLRTYSMEQQRAVHAGQPASPASEPGDVTLF